MDNNKYKKLIIEQLQKINEEKLLRYLYILVSEMASVQNKEE